MMLKTTTAAAMLVLLAACGSGNGYGSSPDKSTAPSPSGSLSTAKISGVGTVLTDSAGRTLYFAEQEKDGKVMCTASCLSVWVPAVGSGAKVKAPSAVADEIETIKRPDTGKEQLTYDGAPLYSFTLDGGPGGSKGNNASDSFGGTSFTWHAVTVSGPAASGSRSSGYTKSPSGGYSY